MLGSSVAGYRIEAVAGRGGMGVVYRARQLALDRPVALKLIAPELARDDSFRARFARESRIAASLDHPNVIPVYEAGEDGDRLFIAMRFVDGTDLGRMIHEHGAIEPRLAAELVAQAASALDAAHAHSLVHRDVKPGNLLVGGDPSRPHVYLTDFGLARRDGSSSGLTTTGQWMGTPDYAAPEQIDGYDVDARTDVYALGCVLFAALAGQPPFSGRPRLAKAAAHLQEPPPALRQVRPGLPPAFEAVVARALEKDPADRFQTAGELGAAALAAAGEGGTTARRRRPRPRPRRGESVAATARLAPRGTGRRSRRVMLAFIALLVGAAAAVGITAALGAFDTQATPKRAASAPPEPPPTPPANPSTNTVRCSDAGCVQLGAEVVPPIEGATCSPHGLVGEWVRIDADSEAPLFACQPSESSAGLQPGTAVPDLEGARLSSAEKLLDRLGIDHDDSGGGPFGILDPGNWTVCATQPPPAAALPEDAFVQLYVDRSC